VVAFKSETTGGVSTAGLAAIQFMGDASRLNRDKMPNRATQRSGNGVPDSY
jgi:hypothetical protein